MYAKDKIMPRSTGTGVRQSLHIYTAFFDVDRSLARVRQMAENLPDRDGR